MTDLSEEMQQRRALIERWASADQAFRDVSFTCIYYTTSGILSRFVIAFDFQFYLCGSSLSRLF